MRIDGADRATVHPGTLCRVSLIAGFIEAVIIAASSKNRCQNITKTQFPLAQSATVFLRWDIPGNVCIPFSLYMLLPLSRNRIVQQPPLNSPKSFAQSRMWPGSRKVIKWIHFRDRFLPAANGWCYFFHSHTEPRFGFWHPLSTETFREGIIKFYIQIVSARLPSAPRARVNYCLHLLDMQLLFRQRGRTRDHFVPRILKKHPRFRRALFPTFHPSKAEHSGRGVRVHHLNIKEA